MANFDKPAGQVWAVEKSKDDTTELRLERWGIFSYRVQRHLAAGEVARMYEDAEGRVVVVLTDGQTMPA